MKMLILLVFLGTIAESAEIKPNSKWMKEVNRCNVSGSAMVTFIKQWHLLPGVNTHKASAEKLPQQENQAAIFEQINDWAKNSSDLIFLAEGCGSPKEITKGYGTAFNGWTLDDLQKQKNAADFSTIMTHAGLKIEARYGDKVKTLCSDDEGLIKETQLALSDARADSSYLTRLTEFKDDPAQAKIYLEGAVDAYKLKKDISVGDAIKKIKEALRDDIKHFQNLSEKRSAKLAELMAKLAKENPNSHLIAVWGGLHAAKVKTELEKSGLGCVVLEPKGYNQEEEKLIATLERYTI